MYFEERQVEQSRDRPGVSRSSPEKLYLFPIISVVNVYDEQLLRRENELYAETTEGPLRRWSLVVKGMSCGNGATNNGPHSVMNG